MSTLSNATRAEFSQARFALRNIQEIAEDLECPELVEAVAAAQVAVENARSISFVN